MHFITYNILADCTLHHFPNPKAPELQRSARTPLITKCLRDLKPDVACLQEVDKIAFQEIQKALPEYTSSLALNKDGRFGCAMFLNSTHFPNVTWDSFSFDDGSGRVAQIANADDLTIINVHLDFKKNCDQMRSIVKNATAKTVLCGDFNASENSGTVRIAKEAGFETLTNSPTINTNGRAKIIDFIMTKKDLTITSMKPKIQVTDRTPLPSSTEGSDHVAVSAEINGLNNSGCIVT